MISRIPAQQQGDESAKASPAERSANVSSIKRVPLALLPAGPARTHLVVLAGAGRDCYCYQSGGSRGVWCVWLEDRRITIAEYVATYRGI